ncbi:Fc.00g004600.m01.CDS01 [Cosmosporella sp. VM-42]
MYLYAGLPGGWDAGRDRLRLRSSHIVRRSVSSKTVAFAVIAGVLALTIAVAFFAFFYRKSKAKKPQREVGEVGEAVKERKQSFLGRVFGHLRPNGDQYEPASGDDSTDRRQSHQLNTTRSRRARDVEQARNGGNNTGTAAVDRNTSVRSVMTLPAYRPMAGTNEQVLGREGERDGVDTILDLPTQEEEEALRDEEMETLYQIRLTRRQQIAEREARREERREARRRNDAAALSQLRARTTAANNDTSIADLRSEVERIKENRNRSVSSVSYADVGIARHDGTRIRANSTESERVGLLSDAASMASHTDATSAFHHRDRSGSSAISLDSDFPSPVMTRSRGDSQSTMARPGSLGDRAGSSPELVEHDLGDETMPPPEYEDVSLDDARSTSPQNEPPPEYTGPYRSASQRTQRTEYDLGTTGHEDSEQTGGDNTQSRGSTPPSGRGVGGIPQLPSLRISGLPQIIIEPSSARPGDEEHQRL